MARKFKHETGKTVFEMLTELRLVKASELVTAGDMPISEIAEVCGYNTVSFFIAEYKKRYGITPRAHRNQRCGV